MPGSVAADRERGVGDVRNRGKGSKLSSLTTDLCCEAVVDGLTAMEIRLPGRSLCCTVLAAGPSEIAATNNLEEDDVAKNFLRRLPRAGDGFDRVPHRYRVGAFDDRKSFHRSATGSGREPLAPTRDGSHG